MHEMFLDVWSVSIAHYNWGYHFSFISVSGFMIESPTFGWTNKTKQNSDFYTMKKYADFMLPIQS